MPLPMVHLAIAVRLADAVQRPPPAAFLLGSIAPDAIHMRAGSSRDDKRRTHLLLPPDTADHQRIQALLAQYAAASPTEQVFAAGYAAHLLTDRLWSATIVDPFRAQLPGDVDPAVLRELYYQETDQIDFNLYHRAPWRAEVWRQLERAPRIEFAPLLSAEEIDLWRARTLRWFSELKEEPGITPAYLSDSLVATFIDDATALVSERFATWQIAVPEAP